MHHMADLGRISSRIISERALFGRQYFRLVFQQIKRVQQSLYP